MRSFSAGPSPSTVNGSPTSSFNVPTCWPNASTCEGYLQECIAVADQLWDRLESMGMKDGRFTSEFRFFQYGFTAKGHLGLGRNKEGLEAFKVLREEDLNQATFFVQVSARMVFVDIYLEQGETGAPLRKIVQEVRALARSIRVVPMTMSAQLFSLVGAHAAWCLAASDEDRPAELAAFAEALVFFKRLTVNPLNRCLYHLAQGTYLRISGELARANDELDVAANLAREIDAPSMLFEVHRQRALILSAQGLKSSALREAYAAGALATNHEWLNRLRRLRREFPDYGGAATAIQALSIAHTESLASSTSRASSARKSVSSMVNSRQLAAILHLSRAFATVVDPDQQMEVALDEIIKLTGADRALLFMNQEHSAEPLLKHARNSQGHSIRDLTDYSRTVVERVRTDLLPIVTSGTENSTLDVAQSIMVNDLRSIMAVPLMIRERQAGVIYLDSRIARGIFSEDEIEVLVAMSNYVATAIETMAATKLEMERQSLERDLELTTTVQGLLLPTSTSINDSSLRLRGYYRPTQHCGGDWWGYEKSAKGKYVIGVADVTGHGPGPAMITAVISTIFQNYQSICAEVAPGKTPNPTELIAAINRSLCGLGDGGYWATMAMLEYEPETRRLNVWSAGAPPIMHISQSGKYTSFLTLGSPLGSASTPKIGEHTATMQPGDRIYVFTDGAFDFQRDENQFGTRGLRKLLLENRALEIDAAYRHLADFYDRVAKTSNLPDDVAVIIIDF